MDKKIIQLTILDQRSSFEKKDEIIKRYFPKSFIASKKIIAISGVRRSGKSTLLKQIAKEYINYYYLNFEDERLLDFTYSDFNNLYEIFLSLHGEQKVFFFDEIQNIYGWEKFVNRLFNDGYKIFVTGSNAKLLSSELATSLSGRHLKFEMYPFSFAEFLTCKKFDIKDFYTTKEQAKIIKFFNDYLDLGGFPEVVISRDENELKQLYQDILIKDLIVRFKIKEVKAFRELAIYLLSNISSNISFNNLKNVLGFNSVTTVKNYIEYLEEAYLHFTVSKFDYSLKKQIINDKKIYGIDTGLINHVSFAFSQNIGRILENLVFLELKRRDKTIFYHKDKRECDFLIKQGREIVEAIQVTESLKQDNQEREIEGLVEAMGKYKLKRGLILTFGKEDELIKANYKIKILPIWKWCLGN
ncbi:MAG: ATP-binding protein [bacterium]